MKGIVASETSVLDAGMRVDRHRAAAFGAICLLYLSPEILVKPD
ncbi:hypothetical protein [Actinomadura xylanilytica]|nr:hypothetical protein [Actinomadura xylanilytica]MDL4774545.1 hypothetical protein [Actinomadura xylanilytica]